MCEVIRSGFSYLAFHSLSSFFVVLFFFIIFVSIRLALVRILFLLAENVVVLVDDDDGCCWFVVFSSLYYFKIACCTFTALSVLFLCHVLYAIATKHILSRAQYLSFVTSLIYICLLPHTKSPETSSSSISFGIF